MSKPKRTTQRNRADKLFSLFIRQRDGYCQRCKRADALQCAHVFSRRYLAVRWDERNAIALCVGCHKFFTHNPIAWEDFMVARMGEAAYQELRADATVIGLKADLDAIIERYREQVA